MGAQGAAAAGGQTGEGLVSAVQVELSSPAGGRSSAFDATNGKDRRSGQGVDDAESHFSIGVNKGSANQGRTAVGTGFIQKNEPDAIIATSVLKGRAAGAAKFAKGQLASATASTRITNGKSGCSGKGYLRSDGPGDVDASGVAGSDGPAATEVDGAAGECYTTGAGGEGHVAGIHRATHGDGARHEASAAVSEVHGVPGASSHIHR